MKMGTREQVIHMNWTCLLLLKDTSPSKISMWESVLFTHNDESSEEGNGSPSLEDNKRILIWTEQLGVVVWFIQWIIIHCSY